MQIPSEVGSCPVGLAQTAKFFLDYFSAYYCLSSWSSYTWLISHLGLQYKLYILFLNHTTGNSRSVPIFIHSLLSPLEFCGRGCQYMLLSLLGRWKRFSSIFFPEMIKDFKIFFFFLQGKNPDVVGTGIFMEGKWYLCNFIYQMSHGSFLICLPAFLSEN